MLYDQGKQYHQVSNYFIATLKLWQGYIISRFT